MIVRRTYRNAIHVYSDDAALDKPRTPREDETQRDAPARKAWDEAWKRFRETGDLAALPLKEGQKPTVFHIASLKREHMELLGDPLSDLRAGNLGETLKKCAMMVRWGLTGAKDFVDEGGTPVALEFNGEEGKDRILKVESLRDLYYPELILELGLRIYEVSTPSPLYKGVS